MTGRKGAFRKAAVALAICALGVAAPLALLGATRVFWLYDVISYTNSPELDLKMSHYVRHRHEFNLIAIGSSEVRWGISTSDLDAAFNAGSGEPLMRSFNFGIDGFSPGLSHLFFTQTRLLDDDRQPRILLIGVNAAEGLAISRLETAPGTCGALQKPVLTSPLGMDAGLGVVCEAPEQRLLDLRRMLERIWLFRERSALRDYLTGIRPEPVATEAEPTGFHPHPSAGEAGVKEFIGGLESMRTNEPERFTPLDPTNWPTAMSDDGFFPTLIDFARQRGMLPVFFILPTNPLSLDAFGKMETVESNSRALQAWAKDRGVVVIDLGVQRELSAETDYADFRHLSGVGARKYSRNLGAALAAEPLVTDFLASAK
jgi:hypothetical protein